MVAVAVVAVSMVVVMVGILIGCTAPTWGRCSIKEQSLPGQAVRSMRNGYPIVVVCWLYRSDIDENLMGWRQRQPMETGVAHNGFTHGRIRRSCIGR